MYVSGIANKHVIGVLLTIVLVAIEVLLLRKSMEVTIANLIITSCLAFMLVSLVAGYLYVAGISSGLYSPAAKIAPVEIVPAALSLPFKWE